jgi:hypothetical protein
MNICLKFISATILILTAHFAIAESKHHVAKVKFITPRDGATVKSEFDVKFAVEGMETKPAGTMQANTGHHHIIIDGSFIPQGQVVPKDDTHIHFGDGKSSTKLKLTPGQHKLTLQFADGAHRSYGEAYSKTITVNVK